jgi:hypothetical protein
LRETVDCLRANDAGRRMNRQQPKSMVPRLVTMTISGAGTRRSVVDDRRQKHLDRGVDFQPVKGLSQGRP